MSFIRKISSADPDSALVTEYGKSGNMVVLGELYQRYMELVYGVCLKYLKDPEEAKDAVLNIFEELVAKLRKHEVGHFKAWLYQLAKNHCLMKLRKQKLRPVNIELADVHSGTNEHPVFEVDKEEDFKRMEYCLGQLATAQREVVEMFYLQNKCYKEIAGIACMEVNTVRSFIQNGRRNLKICMEKRAMEKS